MEIIKKIEINPKYKALYLIGRGILYFLLIITAIIFFIKLVYPSSPFYFSFRSYNGAGNSISNPRDNQNNPIEKGLAKEDTNMIFNTSVLGNFSKAKINLTLEKNSEKIETGKIDVTKTYRAFLYPEGKPIGFGDGKLLKNQNNYYIVSDGKIRKFFSDITLSKMGYNQASFLDVSKEDLAYNQEGTIIIDFNQYPNGSLFYIDNIYYQLINKNLQPFISERAFLSKFRKDEALEKTSDFFQKYPLGDHSIGFLNGTLLSYEQSVYIAQDNKLLPIGDAQTFEFKGYSWDSIIEASGDEFSNYTRGKMYFIKIPHPNGTIFHYQPEDKYYLIENGEKKEIRGKNILSQYSSIKTVGVGEIKTVSCDIKKSILPEKYFCEIPLNQFENISGVEYQFSMHNQPDIVLKEMNVDFIKNINKTNLKFFLVDLKQKLAFRYNFLKS